jgi:hypothetical protein
MASEDDFSQANLPSHPPVMVEQNQRVRILVDLEGAVDQPVHIHVGTSGKPWLAKFAAMIVRLFSLL